MELITLNEINITNIIKHENNKDKVLYSALLYKGNNTYLIYFYFHKEVFTSDYITIIDKTIVNDYKFKTYMKYYENKYDKYKWFDIYDFKFDNDNKDEE